MPSERFSFSVRQGKLAIHRHNPLRESSRCRLEEQLGVALAQPKRWVGWSTPQLIDRLAQVGVIVTLESEGPGRNFHNAPR